MNKTITLKDGRELAYDEHGDLAGKPVFFFHGNPGSRFMRHPDETIAEKLGARIITVDRPGYGLSTFQKGRKLLDWGDDIAALAESLGIEKFAVFGVSAGGPYVASVAYKLGDRVTMAAIVSGSAPFDRPNPDADVDKTFGAAYKFAKLPEWLLNLLMANPTKKDIADPETAMMRTYAYISESDKELLNQPIYRKQIQAYRAEAARNGVQGIAREAKILVSPWGFDLSKIKPVVHLWYWKGDKLVPQQMGRYLEANIPHTVPHFLDAGGHFSVFTHWKDILELLVDA